MTMWDFFTANPDALQTILAFVIILVVVIFSFKD